MDATARDAGVPIVFVYRDPRGALASMAHFLVERGEPADLLPRLAQRDVPSALRFLLVGDAETLPFDRLLTPYEGWLSAEGALALRFEDLVGPDGGGSAERQLIALTTLVHHISWQGSASRLLGAVDRTFNPRAGTFRRGRIDGWRDDIGSWAFKRHPSALVELPRAWGYTDTPATAALGATEAALVATIDTLRCEQDEHERARAAAESDSDERLSLVRKFESQNVELTARLTALTADRDEQLATNRELERQFAALQVELTRMCVTLAVLQHHPVVRLLGLRRRV